MVTKNHPEGICFQTKHVVATDSVLHCSSHDKHKYMYVGVFVNIPLDNICIFSPCNKQNWHLHSDPLYQGAENSPKLWHMDWINLVHKWHLTPALAKGHHTCCLALEILLLKAQRWFIVKPHQSTLDPQTLPDTTEYRPASFCHFALPRIVNQPVPGYYHFHHKIIPALLPNFASLPTNAAHAWNWNNKFHNNMKKFFFSGRALFPGMGFLKQDYWSLMPTPHVFSTHPHCTPVHNSSPKKKKIISRLFLPAISRSFIDQNSTQSNSFRLKNSHCPNQIQLNSVLCCVRVHTVYVGYGVPTDMYSAWQLSVSPC